MGLRYRIPFKDYRNTSYEVRVYRDDYTGDAAELTGAPSCFVVSGTDDDFMYVPVRTSTATINVLESDLLLDLYSINNQYAKVELMKEGVLEWTGYIKPEQFTQPYVASKQSVSVECVSALATLEHIEYKKLTTQGVVSLWELMKMLVMKCKGGYRGVYVPVVYGATSAMIGNVLERITLIETNFTEEEMSLLEVLEAVCKFLNWTCCDIGGYLWFVDADHRGTYRLYDEAMENYTNVECNEVLIQDIGNLGSDGNTLDVVPGYNKATVKALNHVFDEVVKDEPFDILKPYDGGEYLTFAYKGADGGHGVRKQFLKPMFWTMYNYDSYNQILTQEAKDGYSASVLNYMRGAILMREADYKSVSSNDPTPSDEVTDFNYTDSVQIRVQQSSTAVLPSFMALTPVMSVKGELAVWADCAIGIDGTIEAYFDNDLAGPSQRVDDLGRNLTLVVSCGGKYYNGESWVDEYVNLSVPVDENGKIKSNRTPFTPYKDVSGYVIPLDFFVGEPEITILCPVWTNGGHYAAGYKIRGLKFGYAKKEGVVDEGENGDRIYENIVNADYMSEADEIEFDVSSYNADGASYSKALLDGKWLTDNLYCKVVEANVRPEELLIRRIVNRYGDTKIKLSEGLRMTGDITPITTIKERTQPGKTFRLTSGEWDYERGRLAVQIQEDVK